MKTAEEILGREYDWLGCDAEEHVAIFSTAGAGYAPASFLSDPEAHEAAIASILSGPACGSPVVAPELPPWCTNTWRLLAERGLFAFDSDPCGGPYQRVAVPSVPIHVSDLPGDVARVVRSTTLRQVRFAASSSLSAAALGAG